MIMDKTLYLIDGHSLIFKMYYAFLRHPMINSKGYDTSILFGFTKYILELIEREKPTHLAVAFDPPGGTFRHEMFPEYKGTRDATPQLVIDALEPLCDICRAMGIPVLMVKGFEADDVIGSMAKRAEKEGFKVYMVTPDKDYGQLISPDIIQYKPGKAGSESELIDTGKICEKYGIDNPEQVIEILTLCGDASDNVPGVKGIGEVGAVVREVGGNDEERLRVHEPRQRARAHPHLVGTERAHHERNDREAGLQRKLEQGELDLRRMLGEMDLVLAHDGRDERETVDPVPVDGDLAERCGDGVRLRRDKAVLDPGPVAGREDHDAPEVRAADEPDRPPRRFAGIRPSRMGEQDHVRPGDGCRRVRSDRLLPCVGPSADFALRPRIPCSGKRAFQRHGYLLPRRHKLSYGLFMRRLFYHIYAVRGSPPVVPPVVHLVHHSYSTNGAFSSSLCRGAVICNEIDHIMHILVPASAFIPLLSM